MRVAVFKSKPYEAMEAIARTTIQNLDDLSAGRSCPNLVPVPKG